MQKHCTTTREEPTLSRVKWGEKERERERGRGREGGTEREKERETVGDSASCGTFVTTAPRVFVQHGARVCPQPKRYLEHKPSLTGKQLSLFWGMRRFLGLGLSVGIGKVPEKQAT